MRGRNSRPILREGKTCWRRSRSARVAFLVDGKPYFAAVAAAMEKAQRRITIIGWDFNSGIRLQPESGEKTTLAEMLNRLVAAREDLHVYISSGAGRSLRRQSGIVRAAVLRQMARIRASTSSWTTRIPSRVAIIRRSLPSTTRWPLSAASTSTRRWDDNSHSHRDLRAVDGVIFSTRALTSRATIDGAAAADIGELTRQRWFNATSERIGAVDSDHDPGRRPSSHPCGAIRSALRAPAAARRARRAREIKAMLPVAVARAGRAIYIETQYFALPGIAHRLVKHLRRPDGPGES